MAAVRRLRQLTDCLQNLADHPVMGAKPAFELFQSPGDLLVRDESLSQTHESAYDIQAYLDGAPRVED
ncbi:MAG: hypothetical protein O2979_05380 [Proteobacteria bacterium]|nr:hypothetical protein [Pseudomonadota bacterium]